MIGCHDSLERAAQFVHRVGSAPGTSLGHLVEALFGLSVAEQAMVAGSASYVDAIVGPLGHALDEGWKAGTFDPFDFDAKLLLFCGRAMRSRAVQCDALDTFARDVAAAMLEMPVVPRNLAGEARLLQAIGYETVDVDSRIDEEVAGPTNSLLQADSSDIREFCNRVAAMSLFGSRAIDTSETPEFLFGLTTLLLEKFRQYDLILGASLLRTLKYLRASVDDDYEYVVEYLMCQQQEDGRFGYYARELTEAPGLDNAEQDLYLPVTVSVVWALAEVSVPGFCIVPRSIASVAE